MGDEWEMIVEQKLREVDSAEKGAVYWAGPVSR